MAVIKQRLLRKNSEGLYDVLHLETGSEQVVRPNGNTIEQDLTDYLPSVKITSETLAAKQDKITGQSSQVVGFDDSGNPTALDMELLKGQDGEDGVSYLVFNTTMNEVPVVGGNYPIPNGAWNRPPKSDEQCSGIITVDNTAYYVSGTVLYMIGEYFITPGTVVQITGTNGTSGSDGKSAYQYAVDGGYTGTEEEFKELMGTGPWLPLAGGTVTGNIGLSSNASLTGPTYRVNSGENSVPVINIQSARLSGSSTSGPFINYTPKIKFEVYAKGSAVAISGSSTILRNVMSPILDIDAANKKYVDSLVGDIASILDSINGEVV